MNKALSFEKRIYKEGDMIIQGARSDRKQIHFIAERVYFGVKSKVVCSDVSLTGCMLHVEEEMATESIVHLRLFAGRENKSVELQSPIEAEVRWCRLSEDKEGHFLVGVQFEHEVSELHGVPYLIEQSKP